MRKAYALAALLAIVWCCAPKNVKSKPKVNNDMQEVKVTKQNGIVDFWEELGKYVISYHLEGTIDSRHTCVVADPDMIPEKYKVNGKKVVFSGTIVKDLTLPGPRMGGEEIFLLSELESIEEN